MTSHLAAGRVLRIDARQPISRLSVVDGCLWLTTTPADEDVILRKGDEWHADDRWPVVVQAIVATTVHVATRPTDATPQPQRRAATMNEAWSRKPRDAYRRSAVTFDDETSRLIRS